ncbi:hypothetical protein [Lyngbya confervoides]|uniref:Uncharacterized protein n=1 Tax=Lyngbya confervoides BDU141951 TaxID=1574623 RepID=A0ABD4T8L3_9CYAN|nr:hypothetical protein [Lyngbya confervoides]MCM1985127.1 hypothetical protein [Lyngbya confervoides BDU141951]
MATAQPDRLDRIEALVETNAQAIRSNSEAIAQAASERQEFREVFQATLRVIAEMGQRQDAQLEAIHAMQSEIRGMQLENRRILDHLFGPES